jgi:hypothetical protein
MDELEYTETGKGIGLYDAYENSKSVEGNNKGSLMGS